MTKTPQDFVCSCGWTPTRLDPWAEEEILVHASKVHGLTGEAEIRQRWLAVYGASPEPTLDPPTMRTFPSGATRSAEADKFDYSGFLSPHALKRFAAFMQRNRVQADGKLRASDNWKRGMDLTSYKISGIRHTIEGFWLAYDEGRWDDCDEAACAIIFNFMGWLHEREKGKVPQEVT